MATICVWGTSLKKVADEAQLEAFLQITRKHVPEARFVLFSRYADTIVARHPDVAAIDTRNLPGIVRALAGADLFVIVGGPFLQEIYQVSATLLLVAIARFYGRRVVTYGTTIFRMDAWWARAIYRTVLESLDAVSVREIAALDSIRDLGVRREVAVFADPRFVLKPAPEDHVRELLRREGIDVDRPVVCITTRRLHDGSPGWVKRSAHYDPERSRNAIAAVASGLGEIAREAQLLLIPMHPTMREDIATAEALRKSLPAGAELHLLSRRYSAHEVLGIVRHCDLVVGSRMSSAVFATMCGTPLVALAYEPRMLDHMHRVGLDEFVLHWIDAEDRFGSMLRQVWRDRASLRERVRARAADMAEQAERNPDVISANLAAVAADREGDRRTVALG